MRSGLMVLAMMSPAFVPIAAQQGIDWKAVETAVGRPAVVQPGDVHRFNFPRSDWKVMVGDVQLRPALALGGWISMVSAPGGVVAMGDLVLAESEVNAALARLLQGGISATAVHHHVLNESPRVMYMHVHGHGDAVKLGETIRAAAALTKIPPAAPATPSAAGPALATPPAAGPAPAFGIDTAAIARTLRATGRVNGGVFQVSVPRVEAIRDGAVEIPAVMGLGTAINFQPTGGGKAAITGDFVMVASEVAAVQKAMADHGIDVTSMHNHMLTEEPRLFFMHFWANDDAMKLARGLAAALDKTNSKRAAP